ncbi:MAG TPA: adenylate/guanylate cyclase domain-containing protein [Puia sp.]|nr:adenylate/guanylate cyclase domain-containing protein [Puia sp.]
MAPETKYAKSGGVSIAYQVLGSGSLDLVYVMGWVSNIEYYWQEPAMNHFLQRLSSFSRLIIFDKRGTGLSDRAVNLPTLEQRMDDVRAVMDSVGSEKAALFGVSEGGPMSALFAATYPERTAALIMYGTYAKREWSPDYPWAPTPEQRQVFFEAIKSGWGGVVDLDTLAPSLINDERFKKWWSSYLRQSASPADALTLAKMNAEIDIRHILPSIRVQTLILHRTGDLDISVGGSRYMAAQIPNAKLVELPGNDHLPWVGDTEGMLNEIEIFLTGELQMHEPNRVLATCLFTDIVGSTELAQSLGDNRWRNLLQSHNNMVRNQLLRHKGREIKTTGDGFLATFDGPARAARCACAIRDEVHVLGIEIRAGLHTGECEIIGNDISGISVHIAARIMSKAVAGEVLCSGTLKDLVAGSGIKFEKKGPFSLKGIPGEWDIYSVFS